MQKIISASSVLVAAMCLAACNSGSATVPAINTGSAFATPLPTNPPASTASYVQIELLARPAVKEALEPFQHHQTTNAVEPYAGSPVDPLQADIKATENTLRPPGTTPGGPSDYGSALQGLLYPNELAVNLASSSNASYLGVETGGATGGTFGGRDLSDNVIDISLGALFGNTLSALGVQPDDGKENNCLTSQHVAQAASQAKSGTFPYLASPH